MNDHHAMKTLWLSACVALLAACAQTSPAPTGAETPKDAGSSSQPPERSTQAVPNPSQPAAPAAVVPERDSTPQATATRLALASIDLLEAGNDEQAAQELKRALSLDPANKLAQSLSRQMTEDPVARFGREWFPYVVKPGDTMSRIAGRFLGDITLFHALARYNGIKVPKLVAEGQTVRVPGKPGLQTTDANRPRGDGAPGNIITELADSRTGQQAFNGAEIDEKAGRLEQAFAGFKMAASVGFPGADAKVTSVKRKLMDSLARAARAALARQNLNLALEKWERVLSLQPDEETALLEKKKVLRLKDALRTK